MQSDRSEERNERILVLSYPAQRIDASTHPSTSPFTPTVNLGIVRFEQAAAPAGAGNVWGYYPDLVQRANTKDLGA